MVQSCDECFFWGCPSGEVWVGASVGPGVKGNSFSSGYGTCSCQDQFS